MKRGDQEKHLVATGREGEKGRTGALFILTVMLGGTSLEGAADGIRFNRDIRPILSEACFQCHGPDGENRKGDLRLDVREEALAAGAIVPGDAAKSGLMVRIRAADHRELMPPPKSNLQLSEEEKAKLEAWIDSGAAYEIHWAFELPLQDPPPPVESPWGRNPVDAFVLDRLRAEGLEPAPEASLEKLARRAAFDLTGLPPGEEELDALLAGGSPDAYERYVDGLLESPAFGERMAVDWLDTARYADTYGYQADRNMEVWPWRDWVIRAFNGNLGYDQFILWQTAGDLLPGATRDQYLATAFNRLHRQTNEGGSIEEEFRMEYVADRVHTTGTAFLGLTLECARCHDHKYDPISQREYYALAAFFSQMDESGLYSHFTETRPAPALMLFEGDEESRLRELRGKVRSAEEGLRRAREVARAARRGTLEVDEEVSLPEALVEERFAPDQAGGNQIIQGPDGEAALLFQGDEAHLVARDAPFRRTDAFSFWLRLRPGPHGPRQVVLHRARAAEDSAFRGYQLTLDEGRPEFSLIHFWPGNALRVRALDPLPEGEWVDVVVTYDGSSRAEGLRFYAQGQALATEVIRDQLTRDIVHRKEWGDSDVEGVKLALGARFRDTGFRQGAIAGVKVFPVELTGAEVLLMSTRGAVPGEELALEHRIQRLDPGVAAARENLAEARRAEDDLVGQVREIMVMRDREGMPRKTYVLRRGAYDAPGDEVEPGTPAAVLPYPAQAPRNRLGLARWLIDEENPLTARVAVNRYWQLFFGRGLVTTPEDFGSQGQAPAHPELLDWLAVDFREHGWDLKRLCRLLVTSATYRQSSTASAALQAADPDNLWLGRGPKHRLAAEQIRDNALALGGLLVSQTGGPSVRPWQPPGLWKDSGASGEEYQPDQGEGLYRRSLYTFWKRTSPPPNMMVFDATNREVCVVRREPTATPLQALVLLNDPQFVEAARALARRLVAEHEEDEVGLVRGAFRSATSRWPGDRETAILLRLLREQRAHFASRPEDSQALLALGAGAGSASAELAAATMLASAVLNHDECVTKR